MRTIDLQAEIVQLSYLGVEFEDLCGAVRSLTLAPGTESRHQLTSKILAANELVRRTPAAAAPATGHAR
ncbi:hypothetical protein ACFRNT_31430 [Streptomyces sp. NPDC056697]|uniref:hypothetical protein n=1 Tax=Streptomyces sp. NPDC056697 TaxID=3345915 RepID=UPI0036B269FF